MTPNDKDDETTMIEPEEKDRWRALAEELGLPPDPEPMPTSRVVTPRAEEASPRASVESAAEGESLEPYAAPAEEPPSRGRRRRIQPSAPAVKTEAPPAEPTAERDGPREEISDAAETPTESVPSDERPRRGRRRRRGGKSSAPAESPAIGEETTAAETGVSPAETGAETADERPRRRRLSRDKPVEPESESPPVSETEEDEEVEVVAPEEPNSDDEDADEETEDFSTWNVPSWAEIIASLYRPDR